MIARPKLVQAADSCLRTRMATAVAMDFNNNAKDYALRNASRFRELISAAEG